MGLRKIAVSLHVKLKIFLPPSHNGAYMTIEVKFDIPYNRIANLLIDSLEASSLYWASIDKKEKPSQVKFVEVIGQDDPENKARVLDGALYLSEYVLNKDGALIIRDNETDNDRLRFHKLDLEKVKKGLKCFAKYQPKHFADFISENEDGTTADVFLQCCLFGEVLYG